MHLICILLTFYNRISYKNVHKSLVHLSAVWQHYGNQYLVHLSAFGYGNTKNVHKSLVHLSTVWQH